MKTITMKSLRACLLALLLSLTACVEHGADSDWITTNGRIEGVEVMDNGRYGFELVYEVRPLMNSEGVLAEGPIRQIYMDEEKAAVEGQVIRLRYMRDEPVIYKLLEAIEYR